jgi:hypothetical protein
MNNINITVQFCEEDRQLLESLMGSISLLTSVIGSTLPQPVQHDIVTKLDPVVKEEHPIEVPNEVTENPDLVAAAEEILAPAPVEPVAETAPKVKPVSLAEFQKAVTLAVSKGAEAKQTVKTIINKYAASVSAVPEDKRADIIAELSNI